MFGGTQKKEDVTTIRNVQGDTILLTRSGRFFRSPSPLCTCHQFQKYGQLWLLFSAILRVGWGGDGGGGGVSGEKG